MDTALDDDLLIKLAGMTRTLPPVSTFLRASTGLDPFADCRITKRGDGVLGGTAPEHVSADPEHWGEPGGLDDLLDKISGARRQVSRKANDVAHAIRARDVSRDQRKDRRDSVIKSVGNAVAPIFSEFDIPLSFLMATSFIHSGDPPIFVCLFSDKLRKISSSNSSGSREK